MANKPEQTQSSTQQSPEVTEDPTSPQYQHKMKLIAEEEERKKNSVVLEQWIETQHDTHKYGGKVRLKTKMKNGNIYTSFLGRMLKGGREAIDAYKRKKVFVRHPQ